MNTETLLAGERLPQPFRYQIYRQQRAGFYTRGLQTDSAPEAVQAFLDTTPAFEGGTIRLWDHHQERLLASAEWSVETTRMGFPVRTRSNIFQDEPVAAIARDIAQREALVQTITMELKVSA